MRMIKVGLLIAALVGVFLAGWTLGNRNTAQAQEKPKPLSHFQCYNLRAPGADDQDDEDGRLPTPPQTLGLSDQFSTRTEETRVGRPRMLCTPVNKKITSPHPPLDITGDHLVCYRPVSPVVRNVNARLSNQLQILSQVRIVRSQLLCVPSQKVVFLAPQR